MRSSLKLLVPVSPINFFIIIEHSNTPYKFNVRKTGSASPDKECRYLGMPCSLPTSNTHLASMSTVQLHHLTGLRYLHKPIMWDFPQKYIDDSAPASKSVNGKFNRQGISPNTKTFRMLQRPTVNAQILT